MTKGTWYWLESIAKEKIPLIKRTRITTKLKITCLSNQPYVLWRWSRNVVIFGKMMRDELILHGSKSRERKRSVKVHVILRID